MDRFIVFQIIAEHDAAVILGIEYGQVIGDLVFSRVLVGRIPGPVGIG